MIAELVVGVAAWMQRISLPSSSINRSPQGIYCTFENNTWHVGTRQHPLMHRQHRVLFANIEYEKGSLHVVYVRLHTPEHELRTEYVYDQTGHLKEMRAVLKDSEFWYATADLSWSQNELAVPHNVQFFDAATKSSIGQPEECSTCRDILESIKVYRTTEDLPFAALLPEVERVNATQK